MNLKSKVLFHRIMGKGKSALYTCSTHKNMVIVDWDSLKAELIIEEKNHYITKIIDISTIIRNEYSLSLFATDFSPDGKFLVFVFGHRDGWDHVEFEIKIYHVQSDTMYVRTFPQFDDKSPYKYRCEQSYPCYNSFIRLYGEINDNLVFIDIDYCSLEKVITETKIPIHNIINNVSYYLSFIQASPVNQRFLLLNYTDGEKDSSRFTYIYNTETREMCQLDEKSGINTMYRFSQDGQYLTYQYSCGSRISDTCYYNLELVSLTDNDNYIIHDYIPSKNCVGHRIIPVNEKKFIIENYVEPIHKQITQYCHITKESHAAIFDYQQDHHQYNMNYFVMGIEYHPPKNIALLKGLYSCRVNNDALYEQDVYTYYNFIKKEGVDIISHIDAEKYFKFEHDDEYLKTFVSLHNCILKNAYIKRFFTAHGNLLIQVRNYSDTFASEYDFNQVFILEVEEC